MEGNRQGAIRRVAHSLVEAIQTGKAAAVFVRCGDTSAVDEARLALMDASRRVRWVDVRLDEPVDPFPAFAAAAQGDRTIFLCTRISDHAMRRLHLEADRFEAMRIRCVFLLPAGQMTLFGRAGRRLWERRTLYLAWPSSPSEREEPALQAARPEGMEMGTGMSAPIRRRIEAALAIRERRPRGNAILVACRDAYHASDLLLASEYAMTAVKDLRDEGAEDELAEALQLVGALAEARGDLQTALDWYSEARTHWEACESPNGLAAIYARLGSVYFVRGDIGEAARFLERALEYEESLGSPARISDAQRFVGMVRERQGLMSEAQRYLERSLKLAREVGEAARIGRALHQLGHLAEKQERLNEAREYYAEALRVREAERDWRGVAATLHQLGNVHYHRAEYPQAFDSYKQAVEIETRIGDDGGLAATLLQIAHVAEERFQYSTALEALSRARPLLRRLQSPLLPEAEARIERMRSMLSPGELKRMEAANRPAARPAEPKEASSPAAVPPPAAPPPPRAPVAAPRPKPSAGPATDEDLRGFRELLGEE